MGKAKDFLNDTKELANLMTEDAKLEVKKQVQKQKIQNDLNNFKHEVSDMIHNLKATIVQKLQDQKPSDINEDQKDEKKD